MPALVIKDLPAELHQRLKAEAAQHHRSMTREAIFLLEQGLRAGPGVPAFTPYKGAFRLTSRLIGQARAEGRA